MAAYYGIACKTCEEALMLVPEAEYDAREGDYALTKEETQVVRAFLHKHNGHDVDKGVYDTVALEGMLLS